MRRQTVSIALLAAGVALVLSVFLTGWVLRLLLGLALVALALLTRDCGCG